MRKPILALIAVVSSTLMAHAADLPRAQPVPVSTVAPSLAPYNWTGFYFGGNIGGAWADVDFNHNLGGVGWGASRSGFIGGVQAGYNWQFGPFVLGIEGDWDWTDLSRTSGVAVLPGFGPLQARGDWDWTATLAGRFGLAVDRLLWYAKLGAGWSKTSATLQSPVGVIVANSNNTNVGVLIGAGVEWAFAYNWSAKLEYNYLALEDRTFVGPLAVGPLGVPVRSVFTVDPTIQMVKVGINYKFF